MKPTRRGRPPLDVQDRSVSVCIKLPGRQFDRLCKDATRDAVTVPELIRRGIKGILNIHGK